MARKNLKHQIIAGLSTTLLLGMLVVNPVFSREEANTSNQPTTTISQPETVTAKAKDGVVTLKDDKVYQTANASFEETLDISQEDWSKLTWTFGNEKHGVKPIEEWKTWLQQENGGFIGEPMFEISGTNTQLKITYHSIFGEKVDKRWPVNALELTVNKDIKVDIFLPFDPLQAEGQRFDPVNSQRSRSVAVITSPCHGEDRGFDSRRDRIYDTVKAVSFNLFANSVTNF